MAIKIILDYILLTLPEIYLMSWMGLKYSRINIVNPIYTFLLPLTIIRMLDLINIFIIHSLTYQTVVTIAILFLGSVVAHLLNSDLDRFYVYGLITKSFIKTTITVAIIQIMSSFLVYILFGVDTLNADGIMYYISRYPMLIGYFGVVAFLENRSD